MNSQISWDEFRLVKAIADAGSLVGAAEGLGLNHSTVFRRLGAVEKALGAQLFERSRAGYRLTPAGLEMTTLANTMSDSLLDLERRIAGRDVKPSGELRVTTVDTIAVHLLPPILARFRRSYPGVRLDILIASSHLNLSRRDADVAIRATNEPPETLVGRRIGTLGWAVYCAAGQAGEQAANKVIEEAPWVGFGENLGSIAGRRWMEKTIDPSRQVCLVNSVLGVAELIGAGVGAGVLPCFVGNAHPGLVRVGEPIEELRVDVWILTHQDLRHSTRVRAFTDLVGSELAKLRKALEGV